MTMLLITCCLCQGGKTAAGTPAFSAEKWLPYYVKEVEAYRFFRDADRKDRLELRREPPYIWVNPARHGGQHGAVYLWLWNGRPEALQCLFSQPDDGRSATG